MKVAANDSGPTPAYADYIVDSYDVARALGYSHPVARQHAVTLLRALDSDTYESEAKAQDAVDRAIARPRLRPVPS